MCCVENVQAVQEDENGMGQEIFVDEDLAEKAMVPLNRMLDFGQSLKG